MAETAADIFALKRGPVARLDPGRRLGGL